MQDFEGNGRSRFEAGFAEPQGVPGGVEPPTRKGNSITGSLQALFGPADLGPGPILGFNQPETGEILLRTPLSSHPEIYRRKGPQNHSPALALIFQLVGGITDLDFGNLGSKLGCEQIPLGRRGG